MPYTEAQIKGAIPILMLLRNVAYRKANPCAKCDGTMRSGGRECECVRNVPHPIGSIARLA